MLSEDVVCRASSTIEPGSNAIDTFEMVIMFGSPHWTHLELSRHKSPLARTDTTRLLTGSSKQKLLGRPSWVPSLDTSRTDSVSVPSHWSSARACASDSVLHRYGR